MDAREFFFITASIAFILISLFVIGLVFAAYKLQRMARSGLGRFSYLAGSFGKTWGQLTLTSIILKTLTNIIRRR